MLEPVLELRCTLVGVQEAAGTAGIFRLPRISTKPYRPGRLPESSSKVAS